VGAPINKTYGELAAYVLPESYGVIHPALKNVWSDKLSPSDHAVKVTRDAFGFGRDLLNMFIYAYPIVPDPNNKDREVALKILEDMQNAWTIIGHYKDLHNKPYTKKDQEQRMNDCVNAIATFQKHRKEMDYDTFITKPKLKSIVSRPKSELSYLYWGWSPATVVPQANLTGIENIAIMLGGMWGVQLRDFSFILALPNVFNATEHHEFHDFRKIGHSSFVVIENFPQVYPVPQTKLLALATEAHHLMGKVNGDIIKYHFYIEHNDQKQAEEIKAAGEKIWAGAKVWFKQNNIIGVFQSLINNLAVNMTKDLLH